MAVDERLCEPRSVPEARIDLAPESDVAEPSSHSPARGLCEFHMTGGLLEPLIHSHVGAIVSMLESLIKSHIR